jgi:hypothetical protein
MRGPHTLTRALWALLIIVVSVSAALAQGTEPPPGEPYQAESPVSDQKAGSVLFFNLYSSSLSNSKSENTRINITNTNPDRDVAVHLFLVDGATCAPADSYICLTASQTASFLVSDIDPGVMGFIVAIATDNDGVPINFNYLIGDEHVKLASGHAANLGAEAFSAIQPDPAYMVDPFRALLMFNDWHYSDAPRMLALDYVPSPKDGNRTLLIINRFGGDLITGDRWVGSIFGVMYNDAEIPFSFSFYGGSCQVKQQLSDSFPRTVPSLSTAIPSGRSGWMKFWSAGAPDNNKPGILGSVLYYNYDDGSQQGHNLHKLTTTVVGEGYFVPVFPPPC